MRCPTVVAFRSMMRWLASLAFVLGSASGCWYFGPACADGLGLLLEPPLEGVGVYEIEVTGVSDGDVISLALTCTFEEPPANWYCVGSGLSAGRAGDTLDLVSVTGLAPEEVRVVVRKDGEVQRDRSFSPDYSIVEAQRECRQAEVTVRK